MKRYYIKNYRITQLNKYLQNQYNCKYLITINGDVVDFANTLKEAKKIIKILD